MTDSTTKPKASPANVSLGSVALRELTYREPGASDEAEGARQSGLLLQGMIVPHPPNVLELAMTFGLGAESTSGFDVSVTMSALFERTEIIRSQEFAAFVNTQGPRMLFPFVREMVAFVSLHGVFETLLMDPIILDPLLSEVDLAVVVAALEGIEEPATQDG